MTTESLHSSTSLNDPIIIGPSADTPDELIVEALLDNEHPLKIASAVWATEYLADPGLADRDLNCEFWTEGWERIGERGLLSALISPTYGGRGVSLIEALLELEGLGLGCRDDGLVLAATSQVLTMSLAIERFATDEQKQTWLPKLGSGAAIGAFSMSEPESGSDAFALTTTATPTADGYVLNGEKAWVTLAPVADVFMVFASTDISAGSWGISAFLIPADTPGLVVGENRPKLGLRTTPFANVTFTDCAVPKSALVGSEGSGASIFSASMEAERGFLLVGTIGALERVLDDVVSYGQQREQFGQPIGSFQGVSHPIADIKVGHESARLLMYKAAALQQRGTPSMMAAAMSKIAGSEAALSGALTAMEVHGARGYVTEYGVERDLRNLSGGVIYGGASAIQKNIIARLLGLPA